MKKKILLIFLITFLILFEPMFAKDSCDIVFEKVKFYKVITYYNNYFLYSNENDIHSKVVEISEDDYLNEDYVEVNNNGIVETTYKKVVTSILKNNKKYKYKNVVTWKKMPKVRSYDIISIGYNSSVKLSGNPNFKLKYGSTSSTKSSFKKSGSGVSAIFELPNGSYDNIVIELYFDVEKNIDATILTQKISGDYAHSVSSVTFNDSLKHNVNLSGINFDSSVINKFDDIPCVSVSINESW